jgi:hypothetical protein
MNQKPTGKVLTAQAVIALLAVAAVFLVHGTIAYVAYGILCLILFVGFLWGRALVKKMPAEEQQRLRRASLEMHGITKETLPERRRNSRLGGAVFFWILASAVCYWALDRYVGNLSNVSLILVRAMISLALIPVAWGVGTAMQKKLWRIFQQEK